MSSRNNRNNSNTNYSETNKNASTNSNSNLEVIFDRTMHITPRVRFATRRKIRKTNKTPNAVASRKGTKKLKRGPYITQNMNKENKQILRNATRRFTHTKNEQKQRIWSYLDLLKTLKEEEGKDFLTEEQRNFIEHDLLGHMPRTPIQNRPPKNA